jgi:serine/threonine protein kinase
VPFIGTSQAFEVSLISEWMAGGTLSAFLKHNPLHNRAPYVCSSLFLLLLFARINSDISTDHIVHSYQVEDVINGLTFMHSLDVIHGDMKAVS